MAERLTYPVHRPHGRPVRDVSVQRLLEWAFGRECAQLELEAPPDADLGGTGFGMEYVMIQRAKLGCRIDGGGGVSYPHEDAETVAAAVSSLQGRPRGRGLAMMVAECARRGAPPDWMPGATPKLEPVEWRENQHGRHGRVEVLRSYVVESRAPHPRNPARTIRRRRRVEETWVPCTWRPTPSQIAAARREYLEWCSALMEIRHCLVAGGMLREHRLTDALPPARPWARDAALAIRCPS